MSARRMSDAQLARAQEQGRARISEADRQAREIQQKAWKAAAAPVRQWYEIESTKGIMSLNARANVEKLIADLEAGCRS